MAAASEQTYTYSNKSWTPSRTYADGNCFFHALFGEKVTLDKHHFYFDRSAEFRRFYWCVFLMFFENNEMPEVLYHTLESCFLANDKFMSLSPGNTDHFEKYISSVGQGHHWVSVHEIPIISTLWNMNVVLFLGEHDEPKVFEPIPGLLGNFPFGNLLPVRHEVIRLANNHFERLNLIVEPSEGLNISSEEPELECWEDINFDDEEENVEFTKRKRYNKGGSAGIQGSFYQIRVLALVLLNALKKSKVWLLSTENEQAGKFDDLVFETPGGDTLLQAKHKEAKTKIIQYEALFSSSPSDFSLPKYFLSFQEIKSRFKIRNVVICSNAGLQTNNKMKNLLQKCKIDESSILHFDSAVNIFYTFNENAVEVLKESVVKFKEQNTPQNNSVIPEEDLKEFLSCLKFFPNFIEKGKLEEIVHNLLSNIALARNLKSKETFEAIRKVVEDWFQSGSWYFSNTEAKAVLCDVRCTKFCEVYQTYDVTFKELSVLQKDAKKILHFMPMQEPTLYLVRLYQKFQNDKVKVLYLNPDDSLDVHKEVIETFCVPRYKFLVISGAIRVSESVGKKIVDKLKTILDKFDDKKLVIVTKHESILTRQIQSCYPQQFEQIKKDIEFGELTDEAQEVLKNKRNITFQGMNMTLHELIAPHLDLADSDVITELSRNGRIDIGLIPMHSDEGIDNYYIHRTLKRNKEGIREQNVGNLKEFKDRIVLISDTAGMGKTTILTNIAIHIKMNHPSKWVIGINLNNHSNTFKAASKKRVKAVGVTDILDANDITKLKTEFMKRLFLKEDNVVLMLDAVDEVNSSYLNLVMAMIDEVKTQMNFVKIFITTRPHLCHELQEKLQVTAFTLEPFSKEDQVNFLTRYWVQKLRLVDEREVRRCWKYAEALIKEMSKWIKEDAEATFAGIPLQTRMLAEVFQERKHRDEHDKEELRNWEECRQFLHSDKEKPKLPKKINLIQLYDLFIETKRDIFVEIKGNTEGNAITEDALLQKFKECHEFHRSLALPVLFYRRDYELFRCYKNWGEFSHSFLDNYVLRAGIVQRVNGEINFIHRTFAEYFVAQCLILELIWGSLSNDFYKLLVEDVLVREEFYVVRAFFDSFVQKELPKIADDTLEAFSDFNYLSILSYSRNSYFHLFAREGSVGLLKFFVTCINFGVSKQREPEEEIVMVESMDMECNTPLHDACSCGHVNVVTFLLEKGANVNNLNTNLDSPLHLAALGGHLEIVAYLVAAGSIVNQVNAYGETVLLSAAHGGNVEVVAHLIEHGWSYIGTYTTALHIAASEGYLPIVKYLIEIVGADVNILDVNERTPLHAACHEGQLYVVQYLVSRGSDVNALNGDGTTPYHDAGLRECLKIVDFLLANGADLNIVDERGETIGDIIQWIKDHEESDGNESEREDSDTDKSDEENETKDEDSQSDKDDAEKRKKIVKMLRSIMKARKAKRKREGLK